MTAFGPGTFRECNRRYSRTVRAPLSYLTHPVFNIHHTETGLMLFAPARIEGLVTDNLMILLDPVR
jgi:hypothetical protein